MNGSQAIQQALRGSQFIFTQYLSDLSDADLLNRPVPQANHAACQIGHLIDAETKLLAQVPGANSPALPAGFAEQHSKDTAPAESTKGFLTKSEYLNLFNRQREHTLGVAAKLSEADLDRPTTGKMAKFCPKIGDLLILISNHTLMHAGQFVVTRRKLGKPILM
jgi:hypothetical protein